MVAAIPLREDQRRCPKAGRMAAGREGEGGDSIADMVVAEGEEGDQECPGPVEEEVQVDTVAAGYP